MEGLEFRESCTIINLGGRMGQRREGEGKEGRLEEGKKRRRIGQGEGKEGEKEEGGRENIGVC